MTLKLTPDVNAYRLLESGPVVLVSTRAPDRRANVMTMGFHMIVQHPSLIGAVIGPWDHSYDALNETGECVIAIPGVDQAETVVDIGNCSGRDLDKFKHFALTALPARDVSAPLIGECLANIECRVHDRSMVERYGLWVLDAVAIWRDEERTEQRTIHHRGDGTFTVAGERLDLRERMVLWKQFQD
jgi:flavin reductase (DIM6/NTAB) family NADH-FMN oxidoreductase RutF